MKLKELAEELQHDLEEGVLNFIIYQVGRQWKYENYNSYSDNINEEAQKRYQLIKHKIDSSAFILNGQKDLSSYELKDIQKRIRDKYI